MRCASEREREREQEGGEVAWIFGFGFDWGSYGGIMHTAVFLAGRFLRRLMMKVGLDWILL